MHRVPGTLTGGLMQPRWHPGTYLGRRLESSEIIIAHADGTVVKSRDFREVPDDIAWSQSAMEQIKGTSYDHTGTLPPQFPGDEEQLPFPQLRPVDKKDLSQRGLKHKERHFKSHRVHRWVYQVQENTEK